MPHVHVGFSKTQGLGTVRVRVDKVSRLGFVCSDLHSIVVTNQAPTLDLAKLI